MRQPLGQYFLVNKSVIADTVAALTLEKNDVVVEIGPGTGALTLPLAAKCAGFNCKILAIEKDKRLVDKLLKSVGKNSKSVEIIAGDALEMIPKLNEQYKLVGNIPYYITGALLRILGDAQNKPKIAVLMVQKEVAERITAKPGKMNLLSAATQVWADISIVKRLKPVDFDPPPEVESAIIKLVTKEKPLATGKELKEYYKTIKIAFKQPRKTLLNNLAEGWQKPRAEILKMLQSSGFGEKTRGQDLGIKELLALSRAV